MKCSLFLAIVLGFFSIKLYGFSQDEFMDNGWRFMTFMGSAVMGLVAFFAATMAFVLLVTLPAYRRFGREIIDVLCDAWNRFTFGCLVLAVIVPFNPWFWIRHFAGIVFLGTIFLWSGYWFALSVFHGAFLMTSFENTVGFIFSGFVASMSFLGLKFACQMARSRAMMEWEESEPSDTAETS